MTDWPLRSERLTIRPATPEDADTIYAIRTRPEMSTWIPISAAFPIERFREMFAEPERLAAILVVERDGEPIGEVIAKVGTPAAQAEVRDQAADTEAEIGWGIAPEHQRQGYATEAVRRLLHHVFEDRGLRRVFAIAYADNEATAGLAPGLGMRLEARHVKAGLHRTEGWVDTVTYALLAEEWRARSAA